MSARAKPIQAVTISAPFIIYPYIFYVRSAAGAAGSPRSTRAALVFSAKMLMIS